MRTLPLPLSHSHTLSHIQFWGLGGGGLPTYADPVSIEVGRLPEVNAQAGAALAAEHLVLLFGIEAIPKHL